MPDTIAESCAIGDEATTAFRRVERSMPTAVDRRMGSCRAANGLRTRWAGSGAGGTLGLSCRTLENGSSVLHRALTASGLNDAVYIAALVTDWQAPTFGGQKNFGSALKLSVYSNTPYCLASAFSMIRFARTVMGICSDLALS